MKKVLFLFLLLSFSFIFSFAQIVPPYSTNFETNNPQWTHYPEYGTVDNWQRGSSIYEYSQPYSGIYAWCTNVNGDHLSGFYSLQTPSFDLSDTNVTYVFSFHHKYDFSTGAEGRVYYSTDGITWDLLDISNTQKKHSWFNGNNSFTGTVSSYLRSRISLDELQGNSNVIFKFQVNGNGGSEGWVIDDFEIKVLTEPDIIALGGSYLTDVPSNKSEYSINLANSLNAEFGSYTHKIYLYHSMDNILDVSDLFLDSLSRSIGIGSSYYSYDLINTGFMRADTNYIFYKYDADNVVFEQNENNNLAYFRIIADSVYTLPFDENFEKYNEDIIEHGDNYCQASWNWGFASSHILSNPHSGSFAWSYYDPFFSGNGCHRYLEMPNINLTGTNNILHFFYKTNDNPNIDIQRSYYISNNQGWTDFTGVFSFQDKGWNPFTYIIPATWDSIFQFRFKITTSSGNPGFMVDDIYVGHKRADLLVSPTEPQRYTSTGAVSDTLYYYLINCGHLNSPSTVTNFYLSNDTIFDTGDFLIGQKTEPPIDSLTTEKRYFIYTKPNQTIGEYYIISLLDSDSSMVEMRESNNVFVHKVYQNDLYTAPYFNDFEINIDGWFHLTDYKTDTWYWGNADNGYPGIVGKSFCSGKDSIPVSDSRSHLYTPIFYLGNLSNPIMQFDLAYHSLEGESQLNMDYSVDGGATWIPLDTTNMSFKRWFFRYDYEDAGGYDELQHHYSNGSYLYRYYENFFPPDHIYQSRNDDGTNNCILDLGFLRNYTHVQFRFNFGVDYFNNDDFVYIDNFSLEEAYTDLTIDYVKNMYLSPQTLEIEFEYDLRNKGNYFNDTTTLNLYVSVDSLLDGSDYLVGNNIVVPPIQPDQKKWFYELISNLGGNFSNMNYIIFEIDPGNIVPESDELNNICFFRLKTYGIQNYPYEEKFDNYEYHGWRDYNIYSGNQNTLNYRFTNKVYRSHPVYNARDGEMKLDRINNVFSYYPTVYLESPSFDFTGLDTIFISFNFSVVTNQATFSSDQEGGNIEYSINGGQSWNVLGAYGDINGTNWYNYQNCGMLNNQPGWYDCDSRTYTGIYDASSLLSGLDDVTFRVQFKSKWECVGPGPRGFKLDNFKISEIEPEIDLIAVHHGDSVSISPSTYTSEDTILFSVANNGNLYGSSNITFRWSDDTLYDSSDDYAGISYFYNALPNDTITFECVVDYPSYYCDSNAYLVYEINTQTGINRYQVNETNYSNNYGYLNVHLRDLHWFHPVNELNITNDTILCNGDEIVLKPVDNPNNPYLGYSITNWNNGDTGDSITVTTDGTYFVYLETYSGCSTTTDSITVQFLYNNVGIQTNGSTTFCEGDSVELFITDIGNAVWITGETDSVIYAHTGIDHWVQLISPEGCVSSDTISLYVEYPVQPTLTVSGDQEYCGENVLISAAQNFSYYYWNTGDSRRVISVDTSGSYYYFINYSCGMYYSDTINVTLYDLIDTIIPDNYIVACEYDTVNVLVNTVNNTPVSWYNNLVYNEDIYTESFNYPVGSGYPNSFIEWWVTPNSYPYPSFGINSDGLSISSLTSTVSFHTDLIDISDYFNIDIRVKLSNSISDTAFLYYSVDGGPYELFGAVANDLWRICSGSVTDGNYLEVIVVFTASSTGFSGTREIEYVLVEGQVKDYNASNELASGFSYDHIVSGDEELLIVVDNGVCEHEEILVITESDFDPGNPNYDVCPGVVDTLELHLLPNNYDVFWNDSPYIIDTLGGVAVIEADSAFSTTVVLTNEDGCQMDFDLSIDLYNVDTSVWVNYNDFYGPMFADTYQWYDCTSESIIPGQTNYIFYPAIDGSYAVIVSENGCIDTSSCHNISGLYVENEDYNSRIKIYPNPFEDKVYLDLNSQSEIGSIALKDVQGRLILQYDDLKNEDMILDLNDIEPGTYFIEIGTNENVEYFKIIKGN